MLVEFLKDIRITQVADGEDVLRVGMSWRKGERYAMTDAFAAALRDRLGRDAFIEVKEDGTVVTS